MIALHSKSARQLLFPQPLTLFAQPWNENQRMAESRVVTQGPTELVHKDLPVLL